MNVYDDNYLNFLRNDFSILLEALVSKREGKCDCKSQDGASPYYVNIVKDFLNETFPNLWIGRGDPDLEMACKIA